MKTLLIIITTIFSFNASAKEIIKYPGGFPISREVPKMCTGLSDKELAQQVNSLQRQTQSAIQCGNLELALEINDSLVAILEEVVSVAPTGNCFSQLNCGRPKLGGGWVTKATCKTAGGESWEQVNPTVKPCQNI